MPREKGFIEVRNDSGIPMNILIPNALIGIRGTATLLDLMQYAKNTDELIEIEIPADGGFEYAYIKMTSIAQDRVWNITKEDC